MLLRRIWWELVEEPENKTCSASCPFPLGERIQEWRKENGFPPYRGGCGRRFYSEFMWLAKLRRAVHRCLALSS